MTSLIIVRHHVAAQLTSSAIYVNVSSDRLRSCARESGPSMPISEGKRWTTGAKLLAEAKDQSRQLPLIFAQYAPLTFWAIAVSIEVSTTGTRYSFASLRPLSGRRRSDLTVQSSGAPLPDDFIRSYAIVRTPDFLSPSDDDSATTPEELVGLEGEALTRMVLHRQRETALRDAKVADVIRRTGRLLCEVPRCSFDFLAIYGEPGRGYAQVHHLHPLAKGSGPRETRLSDLAVVCANCHAIIHRGGGCRDMQTLIVCGDA
ncbi:MAG: hypothetical protein AYP45_07820 [Candidatus Brocadia carolinensis]|uniref:HNH domain-containing protein n=1 Tax=Candidatus Brocadia carolinensis TaxID=1004156 RepID=A0A1V4AU62_9BACT|nr:MAG: hypothetical protein AYP45_07820 [Candidatus Brocadia caroliniensis]